MPTILDWYDIAWRLALTVVAGLLIGLDRGEKGHPAGLRTTLLVCLAASLAMILANLLLDTTGKAPDSFVNFDVMRLPLGILTGVGFIGAGAILRRGDTVKGLTTAATLWFVTVLGLCFGGGQIALGVVALALALVILAGVKRLEAYIPRDRLASVVIAAADEGPRPQEIRARIATACAIHSWSVAYGKGAQDWTISAELQWHRRPTDMTPPEFFDELARAPGVSRSEWRA